MNEDSKTAWKALTEEVDVAGHQLIGEINRLLAEGNVRKLVIKSDKGDVFVSVPLTGGAVAGGIVAIAAPWLVVIAAIAGLVARVKIEVVREEAAGDTAKKAEPASGNKKTKTAA